MMSTYFTEDHEWVSIDGDVATVGITAYAQEQLGDVVFVELPEIGKVLAKGTDAAVVESVKAASEVIAPVSGAVVEINDGLTETPEKVNEDPENTAWFFKVTLSNADEVKDLMDADGYKAYVDAL